MSYPSILYIGNKLAIAGFTPTNIDSLGPLLEAEGYSMYYASSKVGQVARLADMLSAIVRCRGRVKFVLIDVYSTKAFYFAWLSARLCKVLNIRYIPILHGGNLPARLQASPGKSRQLLGNSYRNIVISGYLQQHVEKAGYKSLLIPNNIEIDMYPFQQRTSVSPDLLWVRSFHELYNPGMAIRVLQKLTEKYPQATLTMVGPDKDGSLQKCKNLAEELGLEKQVQFTGMMPKTDWIKLSVSKSIFINTTNFDNLPVSVIEAMALGMPVVSTNVGGIPYLVDDNTDGMLVNAGDEEGMYDAITGLLHNAAKSASISTEARKKAEQYNWQQVKEKWNSLLLADA